jgi:sulfatase modifying factor 1
MDEVEVTNFYWLEYLYWLDRVFAADYPEIYKKALPDTLVWRSKLAFNEPYVEYYLRHPAYRDYPVVGMNWLQANDLLCLADGPCERGDPHPRRLCSSTTRTRSTRTTSPRTPIWPASMRAARRWMASPTSTRTRTPVTSSMEDGILLPRYRLPTEAEWEYAAYGLVGNTVDERVVERRIYPWNGHWVRYDSRKKGGAFYGDFRGNFMRGRGDYMGVAGSLNDNADVTAPVFSYWPNDYGLYNMAGNVSEWVMDVYRPLEPRG